MQVDREIRFAVVMYGGVSLAIYINGVAQELLNMVRATAPNGIGSADPLLSEDKLTGAQSVYRLLGRCLKEDGLRFDPTVVDGTGEARPIRTRFIVDVISGTSAGGINGVFLAKALALNQTMEGLKQLWVREGDLAKLLNDSLSIGDLKEAGFTLQRPQQSLLNSQRMYRKLLEALANMDEGAAQSSVYGQGEPEFASPLVSELDLFTTTTDIEGIPLPIALSDTVVFERRYKNVFHFRYARATKDLKMRNDFAARNDPFLAFAARCTSSFPFAFEPMCLKDIVDITENYPRYADAKNHIPHWDDFFSEYLRPGLFDLDRDARGAEITGKLPKGEWSAGVKDAMEDLRTSFLARAFGDGGYLDNKPFSYATSTLMRRHGDGVIKRNLFYVEPSPEHPELFRSNPSVPDFAENIRAAVLELPRRETIREDIETIYERNRVIQRLKTFAREVDEDVTSYPLKTLDFDQFRAANLPRMVSLYGIGYGAYHRLKVGEVTSFLAEVITRAKGHDPGSDAGMAIRELIAAWRDSTYTIRKTPNKKTENEFLLDFDIHHRFRRIVFLSRRISELLELDPLADGGRDDRMKQLLRISLRSDMADGEIPLDAEVVQQINRWLDSDFQLLGQDLKARAHVWLDAFCNELERIKKEILAPALKDLRATEGALLQLRSIQSIGFQKPLQHVRDWFDNIKVPWPKLKEILSVKGTARTEKAKAIFLEHANEFSSAAEAVRDFINARKPDVPAGIRQRRDALAARTDLSSPELIRNLRVTPSVQNDFASQGALAAQRCVLEYYQNFLRYDMVIYPVEYGTGAGEANEVEIFRVSPEDANALMEERGGAPREKLAGRTLMSFGAFLDERWRQNDILWGRLDGTQRIITVLLPEKTEPRIKSELIHQAQLGICIEEIKQGNGDAVCRLLSHAWAHSRAGSAARDNLYRISDALRNSTEIKEQLTEPQRDYLRVPQKLDRQLDREKALRYISRSTTITSNMLDHWADKHRSDPAKQAARWMSGTGRTLWKLIAVAVPQGLGSLFFRYWIGLLYGFSILMIILGIAISDQVKAAGWAALGMVIFLHLTVATLGTIMSGQFRLLRILRLVSGFFTARSASSRAFLRQRKT